MTEIYKHAAGEIWLGDCLELMRNIPDASIDMVLADLPYGTTQNKWDSIIPFASLWSEYWRVIKPSSAVVLTASQPFTSALIMSQPNHFKYEWIWNKSVATGHLNAKKQPMRKHENICVFYRNQCLYNPQMTIGENVSNKPGKTRNKQNTNYNQFNDYERNGKLERYPITVLEINGVNSAHGIMHPTQKPVALFEYLIRTYTEPGAVVLDNTSGSGTTAVAAINSGRRFLCIEKEPQYFYGSVGRVASC